MASSDDAEHILRCDWLAYLVTEQPRSAHGHAVPARFAEKSFVFKTALIIVWFL